MTESISIGFIGGYQPAQNVRNFLSNLHRILEDLSPSFDFDLIVSSDADEINGFRNIDPGLSFENSPINIIRNLRSGIKTYVKTEDPDILFQVTRFPTHGTAMTLAGQETSTPTVARLAGDNFSEYKFTPNFGTKFKIFGLKNILGRVPLHLADHIIVLGPHGRQQVMSRGRRSKTTEIPQPVDTESFYPVKEEEKANIRSDLELPELSTRTILTVGRLTRRKGIHDVATTVRKLDTQDVDIQWVIVGDGPLRDDLQSIDSVTLVGRVPYERMPKYYQAADLLVHPSLHDGLPNTLLEATACGLPTIARDVGDCDTVASATFRQKSQLPELICRRFDSPSLPDRFNDAALANQYTHVIAKTVNGSQEM